MMAKVIFLVILAVLEKHMTIGLCTIKGGELREIKCQKLSSDLLKMELNDILESNCNYNVIRKLTVYESYISNSTFQHNQLSGVENLHVINSNLTEFQSNTFKYFTHLRSFVLSNSNLLFFDAHNLPSGTRLLLNLTNSNIQKVFNFNQDCIILSYSNISVIDKDSFSTNQNVFSLILDHCKINRIHEEAFSNLHVLSNLDLHHNNLTNLNFRVDSSSSNFILNVSHNKITNLKIKNVINFLSKVVQLDLSYNKITKISNHINSTDSSSSLEYLYLNNNNISFIKNFYFQSFKRLLILNLSSNPIHLIEPYALLNLQLNTVYIRKSLQILDQNVFSEWCSHQRNLDLSDSNITNIKDYSFINCKYVEFLYLQNNNIKKLTKNVFNGLFTLQVLNLSNNKIVDIELGAFNISSNQNNLRELHLSVIMSLEPRLFVGLRSLKSLFLTKSVIPQLTEGAFRFLPTLEELNLQYNTFDSLESRTFIGLPSLRTLNFSHSLFDTLNKGVFNECSSVNILDLTNITLPPAFELDFEGLSNLKTLFLRKINFNFGSVINLCGLQDLHHLHLQGNYLSDLGLFYLPCLSRLTFLSVENNNIFNLDSDTFKNLKELIILNLANNEIASLPYGLFQDLTKLEELHLENNIITHLNVGIFSPLKSLNYLNISSNRIDTFILWDSTFSNMINLRYLDLRFNKLAFREPEIDFIMHMPSLVYIGISGNQWYCSALATQLNFLKSKNIAYEITPNLENNQYNDSNVDGIYCTTNGILL